MGGHRPQTTLLSLAIGAAVLAVPAPASSQIVLSQDFDSGSLDVAKSIVNGTDIELAPRQIPIRDKYGSLNWAWVYFKASQVKGQLVSFRIFMADGIPEGHQPDHRYVYSYDNQTWSFFDNGSVDTDSVYRFSNNTPFTADEVYIAYSHPYTVAMATQHTANIKTSPFVSATASGDADLVIGQTAGGTDDLGRTIAPHDLFGYQITDPAASGAKQKIVVMAGNHSGEPPGNFLLQGMVDFLISGDPRAAELRARAVFFFYPLADPDGRWAGYHGSNPENPTLCHNTHWSDPTGFTDVIALEKAMKADTGGTIDYFFDCHAFPATWSFFFYYPTRNNQTFFDTLQTLDPSLEANGEAGSVDGADGWAVVTLNAKYSYTPEPGRIQSQPLAGYAKMGENYALALLAALQADQGALDGGVGDGSAAAVDGSAAAVDARVAAVDAGVADGSPDAGRRSEETGGCRCSLVGSDARLSLGLPLLILFLGWRIVRRR